LEIESLRSVSVLADLLSQLWNICSNLSHWHSMKLSTSVLRQLGLKMLLQNVILS